MTDNLPDFSKILFGDLPEFNQDLGKFREPKFEAMNHYERAYGHLTAGNLEQVVNEATQGIKKDDTDPYLYHIRGLANGMLGKTQHALNDINNALRFGGSKEKLYRIRAITNRILGNYASALEDISVAIDENPSNPSNYFIRAWIYSYKGEISKEVKNIELAYKLLRQQLGETHPLIQNSKLDRMLSNIGNYTGVVLRAAGLALIAGAAFVYFNDLHLEDMPAFQNAAGLIGIASALYVVDKFNDILRLQRRHISQRFIAYQQKG